MLNISPELYQHIADLTVEALGENSYLSTSIQAYDEENDILCTLAITAIIYRDDYGNIRDFVPIWWEFHTLNHDNAEVANDFRFSNIRELLEN